MKVYVLPRVDGGIEVMQVDTDKDGIPFSHPDIEMAKWPDARRAEFTGESHEISEKDYGDHVALDVQRTYRGAWRYDPDAKTLSFDDAAKKEIDAVRFARIDFATCLERLTAEEKTVMQQLILGNADFFVWYGRALGQGYVNVRAAEFAQAKAAVVGAGMFSEKRFDELFAP